MLAICILLSCIVTIPISTLNAQNMIDHDKQSNYPVSATKKDHVLKGDTLIYEVFGMDCPGCHSALEKQIGKLTAVDSSAANWINQEVMIIVKKDSLLKENQLFEVIKKANFTPGKRKN